MEAASQDFSADLAALRDDVTKVSSSVSEFIRTQNRTAGSDSERSSGHCHAASGLRSRWRFCSQGDEENHYRGYRFPPEIIQQAIWLYLRFTLSLRDVEDLLAERGIMVSYETVRRWVNHFGPMI